MTLSDDGKVGATFVVESTQPRALALNVALLGNDLESNVKRGENSGRKLHHDFVVLQLAKSDMVVSAGSWSGSLSFPKDGGVEKPSALAAWVAAGEIGPPLQATGGWLQR